MTPTPEMIVKLPQWAQEEIERLKRQREEAIRTMNEHLDHEIPSPVYVEQYVCTGEGQGPTKKRLNIQTRDVHFVWHGVDLRVKLEDGGTFGKSIFLQWGEEGTWGSNEVAFIPTMYQQAQLKHSAFMRTHRAELDKAKAKQ